MTAVVKCTGVAACVGIGGVFDWIPCVCVFVVFMVAGGPLNSGPAQLRDGLSAEQCVPTKLSRLYQCTPN